MVDPIRLFALENKYLITPLTGPGPAIYEANTEIVPLVEGGTYLPAIDTCIKTTGTTPGSKDAIFIVGWQLNPDLDLITGKLGGDNAIGQLLAKQASLGVDVRIVLNGTLILYWPKQFPFAGNLETAVKLRTLTLADGSTPLAGRVLFDWSGANMTGSHHQKATFIKSGNDLVAFVGGMDMVPDHWDNAPHNTKTWPDKSPWGWHDIGVRLHGEAAKDVWANFTNRWQEVITLPDKHYSFTLSNGTKSSGPFNPNPVAPPDPPPAPEPAGTAYNQSVQVLRSRYRWKIPNRFWTSGVDWVTSPGGQYEVYAVLQKAIAAATQYIYIEDQFLEDSPDPEEGFWSTLIGAVPEYSLFKDLERKLTTNPNLRVIFVGSGKGDPIDVGPKLKNQSLSRSIRWLVDVLPSSSPSPIAVWRVSNVTVHSKLILIDDEFAAIGSANFQSRSMFGTDQELHAAIVAADDWVKQLRCNLWAEHWRMSADELQTVGPSLNNISTALGLWRADWTGDETMWRRYDNPTGFQFPRTSFTTDEAGNPYGGIAPVGPLPLL